MNKPKFTKGEWRLLPTVDVRDYIRVRGYSLICKYKLATVIDVKSHLNEFKWCEEDREESLANAHLIKTSPKLYMFLEDLLENHELGESMDNEIESLLAEARGEIED